VRLLQIESVHLLTPFCPRSAQALAAASVFIASINIFGGFHLTTRMLDMFKRPGDPKSHDYLFGKRRLASWQQP
jgi:hypothetical protein